MKNNIKFDTKEMEFLYDDKVFSVEKKRGVIIQSLTLNKLSKKYLKYYIYW